jgi:hypothetical protein
MIAAVITADRTGAPIRWMSGATLEIMVAARLVPRLMKRIPRLAAAATRVPVLRTWEMTVMG